MEGEMSFQWVNAASECPIVEFDDVRSEFGRSAELVALAQKAGPVLGLFRVQGQAERLVVLRGYAGIAERRQVLAALQGRPDWPEQRRLQADAAREQSVHLMRAITPSSGIRRRPVSDMAPVAAFLSDLRFPEQIGSYHLWLRLYLRKAGLDPLASFATLEIEDDVPALPVVRHRTEHIALLPATGVVPALPAELRNMLRVSPQLIRLEPVAHG
jgi:hypothetical protein